MPTFIHNPKEFWSGVMFLFFGLAAVVIGQDYEMGSAGRMGPGYFPSVLGTLLGVIGLISVIRSFFSKGEGLGRFAVKEAFLVLFGVFLFGMLVRGAGIIIAILLLVVVSSYASIKFRWTSAILMAIGSTIFCVLVFVVGLGLPMPIIGSWFGY